MGFVIQFFMEIDPELVREQTRSFFQGNNTKCTLTHSHIICIVNKDGLKAFSKYIETFIEEAVGRAEAMAKTQSASEVSLQHIELTLAQLLLDFN